MKGCLSNVGTCLVTSIPQPEKLLCPNGRLAHAKCASEPEPEILKAAALTAALGVGRSSDGLLGSYSLLCWPGRWRSEDLSMHVLLEIKQLK